MTELMNPPSPTGFHYKGELLQISFGPQHPSTHGVFRMNLALTERPW